MDQDMIAIIDYGMGNLRSVQKALEKVGAHAVITQDAEDLKKAEKIVLPGVGAMQPAMEKLNSLGLIDPIKETVSTGKPFLGICLGLQLLFDTSTEGGSTKGLSLIRGSVERFTSLKVPHMGWNGLNIKSGAALFKGIDNESEVYFCHSYYVKPDNNGLASTITGYGLDFASSIESKNVYGVQFHPEKSQNIGLKILENFTKGI